MSDPTAEILDCFTDAIGARGKLTIRYTFKAGHQITFADMAKVEKAVARLLTGLLFPGKRRPVAFFMDPFATFQSEEEKRDNRIDVVVDFDRLLTQIGVLE